VALTTRRHLVPRLKKEQNCTSTTLHGPSWPLLGCTLPLLTLQSCDAINWGNKWENKQATELVDATLTGIYDLNVCGFHIVVLVLLYDKGMDGILTPLSYRQQNK
jgi:hypothetical protein